MHMRVIGLSGLRILSKKGYTPYVRIGVKTMIACESQ